MLPETRAPRPAVVTVGDELVFGERDNGNQRWLLHELWRRGHPAAVALSLPDDADTIAGQIAALHAGAWRPLLVSGGLGGTHDDCTREAIARALGVALERHDECFAILATRYGDRFTPQRQRMAWLPAGCDLVANPLGAPGFHIDGIYGFPGFPSMLQPMATTVLDALYGPAADAWLTRGYRLGVPEGDIAMALEEFSKRHPTARIGIYPSTRHDRHEVAIRLRVPAAEASVAEAFEGALRTAARQLGVPLLEARGEAD